VAGKPAQMVLGPLILAETVFIVTNLLAVAVQLLAAVTVTV
jgi:hypothetical protein